MYELLYKHYNIYVQVSEAEFARCIPYFRHRKFKKHQFILQEGDVSQYETYVLKGCARYYEVDDKGQEHIIQFALEDWWIGDMYSFLTGSPSKFNIDCLEDCEVLQINSANQDRMCAEVPQLEKHYRMLIQKAYCATTSRLHSSLSKPALDRYQEFISKYPHIEQRVPDRYIASYLGITPQSLSRIRAQGIKKNAGLPYKNTDN